MQTHAYTQGKDRTVPPAVVVAVSKGLELAPRAPHVVVIDDDDAVRFAVGMLVDSIGWRSSLFASAAGFLESGREAEADCLVLDLQMPGLTGADLIENLHNRKSDVPVIIITAFPENGLARRARAAGARAVLRKPFDAEALVTAIRSAIAPADS